MKKVIIAGSRSFNDYTLLKTELDKLSSIIRIGDIPSNPVQGQKYQALQDLTVNGNNTELESLTWKLNGDNAMWASKPLGEYNQPLATPIYPNAKVSLSYAGISVEAYVKYVSVEAITELTFIPSGDNITNKTFLFLFVGST